MYGINTLSAYSLKVLTPLVDKIWTTTAPFNTMQLCVEGGSGSPADLALFGKIKAFPNLIQMVERIVSHEQRIYSSFHHGFAWKCITDQNRATLF